ncbi:MAG TPA: tetratricopeptide repeat protein [Cytophagales bacterium]
MRYCSPFRLPLRLLLLALPVVGGQAQSVPRAEADSLLRRLQGGQPDTNRVHQLIRLGEYQVYKPGAFTADLDSARTYARQAQRLSRQLHYYPGEAQSLNLLGTISRESGQLAQSITYHQAALRHYRGHRDWKGEAGSYLLLAWSRRDKGDAGQARKDVQQAMALYKAKGYHPGVARACLELGNTYANWGEELGVKIGYYQQALGWWVRAGDRKKQADVHKDLGDLYAQQGNYARTLLELRKALVLYQSVRYPQLQGVYDLMGNMSSALGDYQEGLRYGLLAVRTAEALKDTSLSLCAIYNRLGMTYFRLKQYQKAYLYYDQAMRVARKYNDRPSVIIMAGNLATLLSVLDRPESSVRLVLSVARQYPPRSSEDSITLASRLVRGYTQLKRYRLAQRYCDQLLAFSSRLPGHVSNHWDIYSSIIPFFIASRQYAQARKYLVAFEAYCTTTKHLQGATNAQLWWFKVDSVQANHPAAIRHYQRYKQLQDSAFNETKSRQIASLDVLYETEKKEQALALQAQSIKVLSKEKQLQQQQLAQDRLLRNGLAGGTALLLLLVGVIYNRYRL